MLAANHPDYAVRRLYRIGIPDGPPMTSGAAISYMAATSTISPNMWSVLFALTLTTELAPEGVRVPARLWGLVSADEGVEHVRHLAYSLHTVRDGYVTVVGEPAGGPPISREWT